MLDQLGRPERLQLIRFVCSFAWADLEIRPEERRFVERLVRRLDLDDVEASQVEAWLASPPDPDSIDPASIPAEHRRVFIEFAEQVISVDDELTHEELENLSLLEQLLV